MPVIKLLARIEKPTKRELRQTIYIELSGSELKSLHQQLGHGSKSLVKSAK